MHTVTCEGEPVACSALANSPLLTGCDTRVGKKDSDILRAFSEDQSAVIEQWRLHSAERYRSRHCIDSGESPVRGAKTASYLLRDSAFHQFTEFHGKTIVLGKLHDVLRQNVGFQKRGEVAGLVSHEIIKLLVKPKWGGLCGDDIYREKIWKSQDQETLRSDRSTQIQQRVHWPWKML